MDEVDLTEALKPRSTAVDRSLATKLARLMMELEAEHASLRLRLLQWLFSLFACASLMVLLFTHAQLSSGFSNLDDRFLTATYLAFAIANGIAAMFCVAQVGRLSLMLRHVRKTTEVALRTLSLADRQVGL